ncbi:MAG: MFS family permease [Gammaproteobacteria bacterium]|jgi:MFS family permease
MTHPMRDPMKAPISPSSNDASVEDTQEHTGTGAAAVGGCAVLAATMRGTTEVFAVFLLPLSQSMGWGRTEAASIYGVYQLCVGLGGPIAGRALDRVGPRITYTVGLLLLGAGLLGAAYSNSIWAFYAALGVTVGLGAAMIGIVSHSAVLSRWYRRNLTTAIAVIGAAMGLGVLALAPLGQTLIDDLGWRQAYLVLGCGVLALIVPISFVPWRAIAAGNPKIHTRLPPSKSQPDHDDAAPAQSPGAQPTGRWAQLPQTSSGIAAHAAQPIGFRAALRTRAFWAIAAIQFLTSICMFIINPQIVVMLIDHGINALAAASAFGMAGLAGTAGVLGFALIADRVSRAGAATLSYLMTFAGFGVLLWMGDTPSLWMIYLFVIVYGPTFGSRGPIFNAMVARIFGAGPELGTIFGAVHLGMGMGAALGAVLGGLIHDITGGYTAMLWTAMLCGVLALTLYWCTPEVRQA